MLTPFQKLQKKCEEMDLEIRRLKGLDQDAEKAAVAELVSDSEEANPGERQSGMYKSGTGFAAAAREVIRKSDRMRQEQEKREREIRR